MNSDNTGNQTLRQRFFEAVRSGQLGRQKAYGVEVTLKAFKAFFPDVNRNYVNSFLAMAALEPGRTQMMYTKYVIRLRKGVYRVHPDVLKSQAGETQGIRHE